MEIAENTPDPQEFQVELITAANHLPISSRLGTLDITVEINQILSTATFGKSHLLEV